MTKVPKRINCAEREYYKLMELKGKYGEKDLFSLLVKLDEMATNNQKSHIVPINPIVPQKDKIPTLDELVESGAI